MCLELGPMPGVNDTTMFGPPYSVHPLCFSCCNAFRGKGSGSHMMFILALHFMQGLVRGECLCVMGRLIMNPHFMLAWKDRRERKCGGNRVQPSHLQGQEPRPRNQSHLPSVRTKPDLLTPGLGLLSEDVQKQNNSVFCPLLA